MRYSFKLRMLAQAARPFVPWLARAILIGETSLRSSDAAHTSIKHALRTLGQEELRKDRNRPRQARDVDVVSAFDSSDPPRGLPRALAQPDLARHMHYRELIAHILKARGEDEPLIRLCARVARREAAAQVI
jgi:hypothetical protein